MAPERADAPLSRRVQFSTTHTTLFTHAPHLHLSKATLPAFKFPLEPTKSPFKVVATSSHTSSDCVSSTALMVFRGVGAGIAWTVGVDMYALVSASETAWRDHMASLAAPSTKSKEMARLLLRSCGRNVLLFGGFLAVFGGVTCSMEMMRGRHDPANAFAGGFASGLVVLPREMYKTPKVLLRSAALCGAAAMALFQFGPASNEGSSDRRDHVGGAVSVGKC